MARRFCIVRYDNTDTGGNRLYILCEQSEHNGKVYVREANDEALAVWARDDKDAASKIVACLKDMCASFEAVKPGTFDDAFKNVETVHLNNRGTLPRGEKN